MHTEEDKMSRLFLICMWLSVICVHVKGTIERPRGVSISMASAYAANAERVFGCLDGSQKIPFDYVNDDYCDCPDGSDEPGTSACDNGKFHCTNAGYLPKNIQSSRVNDGVCDCCDGTDEYSGKIQCQNNCKELGHKLREELEVKRQLQEQGYKKRQEFSEQGKKLFEERKQKIQELEKEKEELEGKLKELEAKKNEAETPESEAKDKHQKAWEEAKEKRESTKSLTNSKEAFEDLDTDKDGFVDVLEMVVHSEFDIDSNGIVSDEEAKEHLEDNEKVDFNNFHEKVWPNIKQIFKKLTPGEQTTEPQQTEEPRGDTAIPPPPVAEEEQVMSFPVFCVYEIGIPPPHHHDGDDDDEYEEEDDDEDDDELKLDEESVDDKESELPLPEEAAPEEAKDAEEDKMPDYDEDTKQLIAAADEARKNFNEADSRSKEIDREVSTMTSYLNTDFGLDKEFAVLKENCFEYTDREYTYKLCPFSNASQRPKAGGSETSLGNWGKWDGPANDIYSVQKYEKGQNCWNGPDRSVRVHFTCGNDHKLTNAYEPSRCEYAFDFSTPCSCNKPPADQRNGNHDEL